MYLLFLLFTPSLACAAGALLLRARLYDGFVYPLRVTDDEVELGGIAVAFARAASGAVAAPAAPREELSRPRPGPLPRRVRLLKRLGTLSLVLSIGVALVTGSVVPAALAGPALPGGLVEGLTALSLALLSLALGVWVTARRGLARMRQEAAPRWEVGQTEVALLQGRFAGVLCLLSSALGGVALLRSWLN
jgi:hypothetical protein